MQLWNTSIPNWKTPGAINVPDLIKLKWERRIPEAVVIEGVQIRGICPANISPFASQFHCFLRTQGKALTQSEKTAFIKDLGENRLALASCLLFFYFGVANLHPLSSWSNAVLTSLFLTLDLLTHTWVHQNTVFLVNSMLFQHLDVTGKFCMGNL